MDSRKEILHKAIVDLAIGFVGLVVLAAILWAVQTRVSVIHQESNSLTKIQVATQRLAENAAEAEENLAVYDRFGQAKVNSVTCFMDQNQGYENIGTMCMQWGLAEYYLLDSEGKVISNNGDVFNAKDADFAALLESHTPFTKDGIRYYISPLSYGGYLIGGRNYTEEDAKLAELRSAAHALDTIKVGTTGYVVAVEKESGNLSYHPNAEWMGTPASDHGFTSAVITDGYDNWAKINGVEFYCMTKDTADYHLIAMIPRAELTDSNIKMVGLALIIFAVVIVLMIIYAIILRNDLSKSATQPGEYLAITHKLFVDYTITGKIKNVAIIGLVVVFLYSLFIQTLAPLSRQAAVSNTKLSSVSEILDNNDAKIEALIEEYNAEYVQRAKNVAYVLKEDPTFVDHDRLAVLAAAADIRGIYVIDRSGNTVATNTNYQDFKLSTNETDQSFMFWNVTKGYTESAVQEAGQDDHGDFFQYVGVARTDADGMVQLAMIPQRLERRLESTQIAHVIHNIAVENNGFLFAVNREDGTIAYYPEDKYMGRQATEVGLPEDALVDDYEGLQTLLGTGYFISGIQHGDYFIYSAVPLATIYSSRLTMAVVVTLISAVIMFVVGCLLVFTRKPIIQTQEDIDAIEKKKAEEAAKELELKKSQKISQIKDSDHSAYFRVLQGGKERTVQSVTSRWDGSTVAWEDRSPEQKLTGIAGIFLTIFALFLAIYLWSLQSAPQSGTMLGYILEKRWAKGINLFSLTYSAIILLEVTVIAGIIRKLLLFVMTRFGARSETIGRLMNSFIKYAAIIGGVFYCLGAIGLDTSALMTSAGLLSLVVGLGANKLISDIIAGIFIVFEGEFRVGDIVTIDGFRGTVLEIGIRTTKIESGGGDIKIYSNSAINGVINMTKQFSYAYIDVGVEYGESLERVESVLKKELPNVKRAIPAIVHGPYYKGVTELGDSSVNIRILAQCKENDRVQVTRDLNRNIKLVFDRHNINIPYPQVVLNQPTVFEVATKNDKKQAAQFVEEQKELSKDLHVSES